MRTRLVLAVLPVALLASAVGTSTAAPKPKPKPIAKEYGVTAPLVAGGYALDCSGSGDSQIDDFAVPAAGTLKVELLDFAGDWDLRVQSGGKVLGESVAFNPGGQAKETVQLKLKKKQVVQVNACNFGGGPTGTVKVLFTYK